MHIPTATYRIQFNPSFGFHHTEEIVSYLKQLGISDIYASPIFKARTGSRHGYDIIDPCALNPELGTDKEFEGLLSKVHEYEMGWVQDIVPNHMAFDGQNKWLMDVLEKGKKSAYWKIFDIEWEDTYQNLKGKILAPFLGRFYSFCLVDKEIQLRYEDGTLTVNYYDLKFPLKIDAYEDVFLFEAEKTRRVLGINSKDYAGYREVIRGLKTGLLKTDKSCEQRCIFLKEKLWKMYKGNPKLRKCVDRNLKMFNGRKGNETSFHLLDQLLAKQFFRLTFWKFGAEEINYRRFFNINQLISVRVEDEKVFKRTHRLILDLAGQGKISGLRVDHIDGLYDPKHYLENLRHHIGRQYIVVEKILEGDEQLPASWPVEGATGYQFMNYVNGLFVEEKNEKNFTEIYRQLTEHDTAFEELVIAKKLLIIGKHMAGDIDNLAHHMKRISRRDLYGRDITLYGLKRAIVEVLALFPRYRTYIDGNGVREEDGAVMTEIIRKAKKRNPGLTYELNFIADILLLNYKDYFTGHERARWLHFVQRFQQFTGPLMAKGFEDTTLYIYNRLISLNEVGGNPGRFGISLNNFHRFNKLRKTHWPHAMNTTATHDTKRGEDIRARINVLSEVPGKWKKKVETWKKVNCKYKKKIATELIPDDNDEYFLYQTLIGGFPFDETPLKKFKDRLKDYVIKAVREAKVHTAWIQPDEEYEKAYLKFIDKILRPSKSNGFLKDFLRFQKQIAHYGIFNSLSQTLIKLTAPGVPDLYQGCEGWDFSFVDPDNRRPVDYERRRKWLDQIREKSGPDNIHLIRELLKSRNSGQIKMYLIWKTLQFRARREQLFQKGGYVPIKVSGKYKENIIAFARHYKGQYAVTVAPRFLTKVVNGKQVPVGQVWGNTCLLLPASCRWTNALTGQIFSGKKIYVREAFKYFPAAILTALKKKN